MTAEDIEMIQTAETIVCKGNGRVFVSVDKVLEIIDTAWPYVSGRVDVAAELTNRMVDRKAIREAILALKEGAE